jgi:hypothetical protein
LAVTQTTTRWHLGRGAALALALGASSLGPRDALADDADPPVAVDEDALVEQGAKRAAAADTRAGHWLLSARSDVVFPAGSVVTGVGSGSLLGVGPTFGATLGYGVSRHVAAELSAGYALFTQTSGCAGCSGRSFDAGLGVSYRLAQGIAVDPWASFGMGFRSTTFSLSQSAEARLPTASGAAYAGLDVARLAFGADFFPHPKLGIGPFVGADFGTFLGRPALSGGAADPGGATYAFFHVGLRVTLDPTRGPLQSAPPKTARLER